MSLLLGVFIEKYSSEVVCKYAPSKSGWSKLIKKLDKTRRQKQTKQIVSGGGGDEDEAAADAQTLVSESKSARPDSIFYMIDDSDADAQDDEDKDLVSATPAFFVLSAARI